MSYNSKYKGTEVEELLDSIKDKQDVISDLDIIRTGANKGSTALQGSETSDELDDVETNTYVKYVAQTLTEEQQKQARKNIGIGEVNSMNYDLNVKAINHRGYSYESPENTIPAYIMSK